MSLLLASHGCSRPELADTAESAPPFSFRSLDLQQRTKEGLPAWTLKSPEARYNIRSGVARALRPEGVIFAKGKPLYQLAATTGTVVNDGTVILLEGAIRLQRLGDNPLVVLANRAVWIPRDSLMRFDLAPQVRDPRNRISSQTATLHLDRDLLELRGEPRLERWSQPVLLSGKPIATPPEIIGTVKTLDWQPGKGDLQGQGPVLIQRRPPNSAAKAPPQVLRASRLEGNTLLQRYTLRGPVRFDDPAEKSWFQGGDLTFDSREQWLTSGPAFEGQKGELQVRGEELRLDGKQTTATIARDCQLQQNGAGLQARRCQWNWTTQAVEAEGDVLFRRQDNRQLTRAQRLQGQLGEAGNILATTPGGRVITELQVPRRAGPPSRPRVPAKPEPIVF
jgi:LPS export ABC transporter protein LptC